MLIVQYMSHSSRTKDCGTVLKCIKRCSINIPPQPCKAHVIYSLLVSRLGKCLYHQTKYFR